LSGKVRGEPKTPSRSKGADKMAAPDRKARKQRSSDLGRALRSAYDDTLREPVPDEFLDILGKLR